MKKILILMTFVFLLSGCRKASDLLIPEPSVTPMPIITASPEPEKKPEDEIYMSQVIHMSGDWTILGDYRYFLTNKSQKDKIILATSAETMDGEIQWDDAQYWTLVVISKDGVYNLFTERMSGYLYMEVNEAFVRGLSTPIITLYNFSSGEREIRHFIFDEDHFEETVEYTGDDYSTGGINNLFSTLPEPVREKKGR